MRSVKWLDDRSTSVKRSPHVFLIFAGFQNRKVLIGIVSHRSIPVLLLAPFWLAIPSPWLEKVLVWPCDASQENEKEIYRLPNQQNLSTNCDQILFNWVNLCWFANKKMCIRLHVLFGVKGIWHLAPKYVCLRCTDRLRSRSAAVSNPTTLNIIGY